MGANMRSAKKLVRSSYLRVNLLTNITAELNRIEGMLMASRPIMLIWIDHMDDKKTKWKSQNMEETDQNRNGWWRR